MSTLTAGEALALIHEMGGVAWVEMGEGGAVAKMRLPGVPPPELRAAIRQVEKCWRR